MISCLFSIQAFFLTTFLLSECIHTHTHTHTHISFSHFENKYEGWIFREKWESAGEPNYAQAYNASLDVGSNGGSRKNGQAQQLFRRCADKRSQWLINALLDGVGV